MSLARKTNLFDGKKVHWKNVRKLINTLRKMLEITGLCQKNIFHTKIIDYEIDKLLKERNNYRKVKEFEKADNIRKILQEKGIGIIDNNNGTSSWEKL